MAKTSVNSRSNLPDHNWMSSRTRTNRTLIRNRCPERWTEPSRMYSTSSCFPTSRTFRGLPLKAKAEVWDRESFNNGEVADNLVRKAVGKVLVRWILAQVIQRQNRDRNRRAFVPHPPPAAYCQNQREAGEHNREPQARSEPRRGALLTSTLSLPGLFLEDHVVLRIRASWATMTWG